MSNLLLRLLKERGVILDGVTPFGGANLIERMAQTFPGKVVMEMPNGTAPGPYWLVSAEDAKRMEQAGYQRHEACAIKLLSGGN